MTIDVLTGRPSLHVRARGTTTPGAGYDVHGLMRIGLRNASPADIDVVGSQLGLQPTVSDAEPDVVINFVDRLSTGDPLRLVGVRDAGFTDDGFVLLRGKHKTAARVRLPMADIGSRCEITCERGLAAVPFLIAIINATVLGKGVLPMHASAFRYGGSGVLVTGWSKGGKTELLLGFAAQGAEYVGDEWIYLDGMRMYGIPEPMRLWDWHLEQMPACWQRLTRSDRARLRVLRHASQGLVHAANAAGRGGWERRLRRLTTLIDTQRYTHLSPLGLFGPGAGVPSPAPDTVIFVASHESPTVTVEVADPDDVAARMAFSLQEERAELMACYRKFRFAFPGIRNPRLEAMDEIERGLLHRCLRNTYCLAVHHPYPPSIPALFSAVKPSLEARAIS